jgi:tRNA(Arg) A34 adenosine deaminase TadA
VALAELERAERLCLELAWEAFGAGSVPVGAVLLGADGAVLATGRSRMYEPDAPSPQLANSLLAHAEVNALIGLDPHVRYEDHTLVTALEPCPLCMGALAMSTVGALRYLGADPYGGAVGLLGETPHTARVPVRITGPRRDNIGTLATTLLVACYLRRNPKGHVVRVYGQLRPDLLRAAQRLLDVGAYERAHAGEPVERVTPDLLDALGRPE